MTLNDPDRDELAGRLRGLVVTLSTVFTAKECLEVEHFIDHGEFGEALRALAWIVVDEEKNVPTDVESDIARLGAHMGIRSDLPARLRSQARGGTDKRI